ncbi:NfeD family protein [Bdellovibrio sp. HCB337]|uniref:NfeD family protein n=1 Tax=Bdellovibrio sp. HCB337 TaxID=3394358 RepID=UPI0039A7478F
MILAFQNELWMQLLVAGAILVLAEAIIPGFIVLPIGIGFILTAGVAAATSNLYIILPVAGVFQFLSFFLTRKYLKHIMDTPKKKTTAEGMVGQEAAVTEEIPPGGHGYVKLYGDLWMARSYNEKVLPAGTKVTIKKIDGNKVWVQPLNEE